MSVSLPFIFTYHLPLSPITHSLKNLQRTKEPPLFRVVLSFQDFGLLGVSFAEFSVALMFCLWKGWRNVFSQRCSLSCSACPTSMAKKSGLLTFHCGILFTSKSIHLDLRLDEHFDQNIISLQMKHETGGRNKGHIRGLFFCPMNSIFYLPKWKSRLTDLFSVHVTTLPVRLMIAAMFPPQLSSQSSHLGTSQSRSTDTRAKKYGLANIHTHF